MLTLREYIAELKQIPISSNDFYRNARYERFLNETLVLPEQVKKSANTTVTGEEIKSTLDPDLKKDVPPDDDIKTASNIDPDIVSDSGSDIFEDAESEIHFDSVINDSKPKVPYLDLVDALVAAAASENHTLGLGYVELSTANLGVHSPSVAAAAAQLKELPWQMLHNHLGQNAFIDLVTRCKCYVPRKGSDKRSNPHISTQQYAKSSIQKNVISTLQTSTDGHDPPQELFAQYLEVFGRAPAYCSPKTLVSLQGMLYGAPGPIDSSMPSHFPNKARFIAQFKRISYKDIYNTIVKDQDIPSPIGQVSAFVHAVVSKIFAKQWAKPIRNKIFRAVASFIRLRKNSRLDLSQFGPDEFTLWLFQTFISSLVRRFWYVTETGTSTDLCFYPHPLWKQQSNLWLKNYQQRFLVQTHQCKIHGNGSKVYLHGRARLIPKNNGDFRLLCVPLKGPGYFSRLFTQIQPVRDILRYCLDRRSSTHLRCHSSDDLIRALNNYRILLPDDHGQIYLVKFDMRQSYDRLDQLKIIGTVNKLIGTTPHFYTRQFEHSSSLKTTFYKKSYLVSTSLESLSVYHLNHKVVRDKGQCTRFTKEDILSVIEDEIYQTALIHDSKCYLRKRGVFQGCPLLATLCDVAYSDLVEERLLFLDNRSLLLRLADDFLVLSTDREQIAFLYKLLKNDLFTNYGASANIAKTITNLYKPFDVILFVGIAVDTKSLSVYKETDLVLDVQPFELIYQRTLRQIGQVPVTLISLERVLTPMNQAFPKLLHHHLFDESNCFHFVLSLIEKALPSITIEEFKMVLKKAWTHKELRQIVDAVIEI